MLGTVFFYSLNNKWQVDKNKRDHPAIYPKTSYKENGDNYGSEIHLSGKAYYQKSKKHIHTTFPKEELFFKTQTFYQVPLPYSVSL